MDYRFFFSMVKDRCKTGPLRSAMGRKVLEEPTGVGHRICARTPVATSDSPRLHGKRVRIPLEIRSSNDRVWSTLPVKRVGRDAAEISWISCTSNPATIIRMRCQLVALSHATKCFQVRTVHALHLYENPSPIQKQLVKLSVRPLKQL